MKICSISDTHSKHKKVSIPECDMLICAGDYTFRGELSILQDFSNWIKELPIKYKIVIFGNHEVGYQFGPKRIKALEMIKESGAIYLEDSGVTIEGLNIWGSPASPFFHAWEFNYQRGPEIARIWNKIPDNTNILITHTPCKGVLDLVEIDDKFENIGCEDLRNKIDQLKELKLHVGGHLHLQGGNKAELNGITYVNAAICDEQYKTTHKPVVIEI
jgi:hypothetical protein